ncbi:hypothetical protein M406DRAFT_258973 [Cryphonectria parasitica EP155]|uniref:Thaumatin-like protein n=1 Tax=Cryphonectria parasitica (strain ATCC 38755 / EP155) TaxID=660469 RepID=A0A9P5CNJ5_CRYP1|nr:uncharacterized protein M406DRAFT_258973 [Cryphonectria parasitica EP155]KAF3764196.1 hypothetical protein M406DRAFT_258973 [Cryphonectria parasitica EP155]
MQLSILSLPLVAALVAAIPNAPGAKITPAPFANKRDLQQITVTIVNSMGEDLSTSVASNGGDATLVSGGGTGTLAANSQATIVAPQNWNGNVAFGLAKYSEMDVPSLIEPGLTQVSGTYMMDIDVSYVNGYTVPITCTCNDDNSFLSGCSTDLFSVGTCGQDGETDIQAAGACQNPTNEASGSATSASPFFAPCAGKAYTFPNDNGANSEGKCTSGAATCCVGTSANGCPST